MPDKSGFPLIWEVWSLNQISARGLPPPGQSMDPKENTRPYLIIADPIHRSVRTCCPIQERLPHHMGSVTEVPLNGGYGGFITKDCRVICHEIYTFQSIDFIKHLGTLETGKIDQIKDALFEFLKI